MQQPNRLDEWVMPNAYYHLPELRVDFESDLMYDGMASMITSSKAVMSRV